MDPLFIEDSDDSANEEANEGPDGVGRTFDHTVPIDSGPSHATSNHTSTSPRPRMSIDFARLDNSIVRHDLFPRESQTPKSDTTAYTTQSSLKKEGDGTDNLMNEARNPELSELQFRKYPQGIEGPQRKKLKMDSISDDLCENPPISPRDAAIRDGIRRRIQNPSLQGAAIRNGIEKPSTKDTSTSASLSEAQKIQGPSNVTLGSKLDTKTTGDDESNSASVHRRRLQSQRRVLEPDSDEDELDGLHTPHRRNLSNIQQAIDVQKSRRAAIPTPIERRSLSHSASSQSMAPNNDVPDANKLLSSSSEDNIRQPRRLPRAEQLSKKLHSKQRVVNEEAESDESNLSPLTSANNSTARLASKPSVKYRTGSNQRPLRLTSIGTVDPSEKETTSSESEAASSESRATQSQSEESQSGSEDIPKPRKKAKVTKNTALGRADRLKDRRANKTNEESTDGSSTEFSSQASFYEFPIRRSERAIRQQSSYRDVDETQIDPNDDVSGNTPRRRSNQGKGNTRRAKEGSVKEVAKSSPFVQVHYNSCQQCFKSKQNADSGNLVMCQGCSFAYHTKCCNRKDHVKNFTLISPAESVFQCRFCLKDTSAEYHNRCTKCKEVGDGCQPFHSYNPKSASLKLTKSSEGASIEVTSEELKPEETEIPQNRPINDPIAVLYRCRKCWRAWHTAHLPSLPMEYYGTGSGSEDEFPMDHYLRRGLCSDCKTCPGIIDKLVAWRCTTEQDNKAFQNISALEKEILIKWKYKSYREVSWMPGTWVENMAAPVSKKKLAAICPYSKPKTSDSVPVSFITPEIILDVHFKNGQSRRTLQFADAIEELQAFDKIDKVLTKWVGLSYEDVTWDRLPGPGKDGTSKLEEFRNAYKEFVRSWYIHLPLRPAENESKARTKSFQPVNDVNFLKGGTLMQYQVDGLNWLLYKWRQQRNCILADEMGLGKTIQVIAFVSILFERHSLWPHLVVAPNSTVSNWKREFQKWAPSLRTVVFTSLSSAKNLILKHEMHGENSKDLRCHVVIASYETVVLAPQHLSKIPWETLTVDEGQRLKNDQTVAYAQLSEFTVGYKLLLTGTPLQNDIGELFNLLQFLNHREVDARALEVEYTEMTSEKVAKLHEMLRPLFLRRTKAEVLKHLPPKFEMILPVRMVKLQKTLYKTILSKNAALLRSIAAGSGNQGTKSKATANLNNILMQLRKAICHPFMYSEEIENRKVPPEQMHQNLIEASGKLELLTLLLPKLRERGRRVLIFSQFLDALTILQDFLDGLELPHFRIDGSTSSIERQSLIDQFNAKDSPIFAFLLSTRAGGVGINLASADTVILHDCDFNPHQDIQALSRAHRIGQNKKVLVFTLMTPNSVEQKILEVGKKKLLLDHIVVETLADAENEHVDVESILQFGARALFENDSDDRDPKYSSADVDKILTKSLAEDEQDATKASDDNSAGGFSFAKVWTNSEGGHVEDLQEKTEAEGDSLNFWDKVLAEREARLQAERDAAIAASFVSNKRRSAARIQNYSEAHMYGSDDDPTASSPVKPKAMDTDFQVEEQDHMSESDGTDIEDLDRTDLDITDKESISPHKSPSRLRNPPKPPNTVTLNYRVHCSVCGYTHLPGFCPFRWEKCRLCGQAHYGVDAANCSRLKTVDGIDEVLALLRLSNENTGMVRAAAHYLTSRRRRLMKRLEDGDKSKDIDEPPSAIKSDLPDDMQFGSENNVMLQEPF